MTLDCTLWSTDAYWPFNRQFYCKMFYVSFVFIRERHMLPDLGIFVTCIYCLVFVQNIN